MCLGLPVPWPPGDQVSGLSGIIDVRAAPYNADPTGVVDATAIFRAINQTGGIGWLGNGTYKVTGTISLASRTGFVGHGASIVADDTAGNFGDVFLLDAVRDCVLQGFTVDALAQRTAGAHVRVKGGDPSVKLGTFQMSRAQHVVAVDYNNWFDGIVVEDKSPTNGAWGVTIGDQNRWSFFRNGATGRFPIDINTPLGASIKVSMPWVVGNATPSLGPAGIRVRGSGDTSINGVRTWGVQRGLIIDPQVNGAETVMAVDVSGDAYFDFADQECFRFNPIAGLTIPIEATFTGTWFASSLNTHNIRGSNGTGHKVLFRGCKSINAAGFGLRGDTGCDATTFANTDMDFGPPFVNASGGASYV